jgi:cytochrome c-type biogenesis protein
VARDAADAVRRRVEGSFVSALGPFALAFVAGLISFTSPCCLPLMPGYVSYVSGVASGSPPDTSSAVAIRSRTMLAAGLFVTGFARRSP